MNKSVDIYLSVRRQMSAPGKATNTMEADCLQKVPLTAVVVRTRNGQYSLSLYPAYETVE